MLVMKLVCYYSEFHDCYFKIQQISFLKDVVAEFYFLAPKGYYSFFKGKIVSLNFVKLGS